MFGSAGGLLFVAVVACAALVVLTSALHHEATCIATADARIRASLRAKVAVLAYARASDLAASERSPGNMDVRAQAEIDLRSALDNVRRLSTPQRVRQLDHLRGKVAAYIALRSRLEAERAPLDEILRRATPLLQSVFVDLQHIIRADDDWIGVLADSARRWDAVAAALGVSAMSLVLLGFGVAITGASVLVYRPLVAVTGAMARFAGGERAARAVASGVLEIRQTAQTFNDMADRLARQDQERLTFLAGVAHDLRNPLSALKLAAQAARHQPAPISTDKASRILTLVGHQVDRLERMVSDLLDATKIEAGHLELQMQQLDVRVLVEHVADLYRAVSPAHEIRCSLSRTPLLADCDGTRIGQVLGNLVCNAIKYSPRGGGVTIAARAENGEAVIEVTDHGIGIAHADFPRIFEPFRRVGPAGDTVPGAGLGLSVAKKIVEAHHGTIDVQSAVGIGSTFRVRLPPPIR